MGDQKETIARDQKLCSTLCNLAEDIRISSFEIIQNAKSGHLGACSSSAELMTALYFGGILNFDRDNPRHADRDRVYVRGHLGPLRYKIFSLLSWIEEEELQRYRSLGSPLQGHECMLTTPGVDITPSGSLGMVLSYAVGAAVETRRRGSPAKHYVFVGDGEEQEGNISEAARHAASLGLENLVCIMDRNRKQLSRATNTADGAADVAKIWEGYGWDVEHIVDGHDMQQVLDKLRLVETQQRPLLLIANTVKALGLRGAGESFNGYHTIRSCKSDVLAASIGEHKDALHVHWSAAATRIAAERLTADRKLASADNDGAFGSTRVFSCDIRPDPENNLDHEVSQQRHYFRAVGELLRREGIEFYCLTPDFFYENRVETSGLGELSNYYDVGIREQHMVAMAHGISVTNPDARIYLKLADAFLYRAADQLHAAAQGKSRLIVIGELSGLSQGKNGETHQSCGQPAVPIWMPGVDYYEPADVPDLYAVLNELFGQNPGVSYVRTHRIELEPFAQTAEPRNISNYVVYASERDPEITLVGSGCVLNALVGAAQKLELECGVGSRVINAIRLDSLEGLSQRIVHRRPLLTVYNGNPTVLSAAVSSSLLEQGGSMPSRLFAKGFRKGTSGKPWALLRHYGLTSAGVVEKVKSILEL